MGSRDVWEVKMGRTWKPWLGVVGDGAGKEYWASAFSRHLINVAD